MVPRYSLAFSSTGCLTNRFRGKAKGRGVGEPLPATQAAPPQDPRQRHLDVLPDDQPELPPPAIVQSKTLFLARTTLGTRLGITHPLPQPNPPGVGLDFLLQIHDRGIACFGWGRAAIARSARPPFSLPTGMLRGDRGAHGGGVLFSHSWGGIIGRGLPRRRGRVSCISRRKSLFRLK